MSIDIARIGVRGLRVQTYRGVPDDGPGTAIQDRARAANPVGPGAGVRAGEVGNFIVTAHRNSAGGPLHDLPDLPVGAHVLVRVGGTKLDYRITGTLRISFRSETSKALQTAAVPGRPGRAATDPMITLSTCATQEDHAAGNYWSDRWHNPEHRIDKVGVLVATSPSK